MKQINHRGYLLVEIEKNSAQFDLYRHDGVLMMDYWIYDSDYPDYNGLALPEGQWEIIGKGNEIKEEVWEQIVDVGSRNISDGKASELVSGYTDYERFPGSSIFTYFDTATESGQSLIKSHGMKPETTLILKLKTNE